MKQFFKDLGKFSLIGVFILIILFWGYLDTDPFQILRTYNDYSFPSVTPNRDFISTEVFRHNYKQYKYNSFILGSSRTLALRPESWAKYLDPGAVPYMFDASSESVYGINRKLKYLDSLHIELRNVLILLCRDSAFKETANHEGHLFIKDPVTSGESRLYFHWVFFKAYLRPKFLTNFYIFKLTHHYRPFMKDYIETRKIVFDPVTNEVRFVELEDKLSRDPNQYYLERKDSFYTRSGEKIDDAQRISEKHYKLLKEIKEILERNHTKYKVVLSPLYEQIRFNPRDVALLKNLFDPNLYDFSGKNTLTDSITNYYEESHFRKQVGDQILNFIYYPGNEGGGVFSVRNGSNCSE